MENKKGVISAAVVVGIALVVGLLTAGAGYVAYKKSALNVEVGSDGVNVKTDGVNVKTGAGGVDVNAGGVNVKTGANGVDVNTGGTNVNVGSSGTSVTTGGASAPASGSSTEPSVNTVLILDASGSMAQQTEGGSRFNVAKNALTDYVKKLSSNVQLSVVVYGHKGNSTLAKKAESCSGIDEVYWMSPVKESIVNEKVSPLTPNGWTPLASSLQKATDILRKTPAESKKRIVLLSDGEETCGGDPVALACKLKSEGIIVDVIALNVNGVAAKQLSGISNCGGGSYYSVKGASDLGVVVNNLGVKVNTGDVKVDIFGDGVNVQSGNINVNTSDAGAKVDAGGVKVDTTTGGMPAVKVPGVKIPSY